MKVKLFIAVLLVMCSFSEEVGSSKLKPLDITDYLNSENGRSLRSRTNARRKNDFEDTKKERDTSPKGHKQNKKNSRDKANSKNDKETFIQKNQSTTESYKEEKITINNGTQTEWEDSENSTLKFEPLDGFTIKAETQKESSGSKENIYESEISSKSYSSKNKTSNVAGKSRKNKTLTRSKETENWEIQTESQKKAKNKTVENQDSEVNWGVYSICEDCLVNGEVQGASIHQTQTVNMHKLNKNKSEETQGTSNYKSLSKNKSSHSEKTSKASENSQVELNSTKDSDKNWSSEHQVKGNLNVKDYSVDFKGKKSEEGVSSSETSYSAEEKESWETNSSQNKTVHKDSLKSNSQKETKQENKGNLSMNKTEESTVNSNLELEATINSPKGEAYEYNLDKNNTKRSGSKETLDSNWYSGEHSLKEEEISCTNCKEAKFVDLTQEKPEEPEQQELKGMINEDFVENYSAGVALNLIFLIV